MSWMVFLISEICIYFLAFKFSNLGIFSETGVFGFGGLGIRFVLESNVAAWVERRGNI